MRLEKVKLGGWVPFRNEVSLDMSQLGDARLVALTGPNGGGKSSLVELALLGACYRQLATRGKLSELAVSRDAFVESTVVNGAKYTIRQTVDAVSGGGECVVLDEHGAPLPNSDTKVSWFKGWAATHFPDFGVLTSGLFSAQGSEGMLEASAVERKRLILKAVGVDRFESMAQRAREHAREVTAQIATLTARITDERARGGNIEDLETDLAKAREQFASATVSANAARLTLDIARQQAAECAQAEREYRGALERRAKLRADVDQTSGQLADVDRRVANNRAVLAEGDAIRAAASELEGRSTQLADVERQRAGSASSIAAWHAKLTSLEAQLTAARRRQSQAAERLAEGEAISGAVAQLPALETKAASAETKVRVAREKLEQLQGQQLAGADERIDLLRDGLDYIARSPADPAQIASMTLENDDKAVAASNVFPERLAAAKAEVQRLANDHAQVLFSLQAAQSRAARADALQQAQVDRDAALAEIDTLTTDIDRTRNDLELAQRVAQEERARIANIQGAINELEPIASKLTPLQHAEARLAELEPQFADLSARILTLQTELTDTPEPTRPPAAPDVSAFDRAAQAADKAQREAHSDAVLLESRLQAARESSERVGALEAELSAANAELADWTRLAADLGKDGLQAAETDAIGPELTELTNDLLHSCFSTRWTVRVETQRASSDGKRAIEGCEIRVLDTETGQDCDARRYSGGQRAIIGEAVSLALAMIACNRAGVTAPTLVRDESDAALNDENAEAYAKMLRRCADHIGADRVLVISHKAALVGLCDAVIEVGGGQVRVA